MNTNEAAGLMGVTDAEFGEIPLSEDLAWLRYRIDKFVEGGVYLLAGEPGIGKTTLALQIALDLGRQGIRSVYVLNEQSKPELKKRAERMASDWPTKVKTSAFACIEPEDSVYNMSDLPEFLSHHIMGRAGKYHGARLIVVDSIQGHGLSSAATKEYKQVYSFCNMCKKEGITTILVAHVTKRGEIAGPKDLQHNVDCVLYMRKAFIYRPLFVPKNRFGPAVLQAIPLEMDRTTTALHLSPHSEAVSAVARTFLGRAAGNAEVQAAVSLPAFGSRGQITAPGLPRKEIEQVVNCISQLQDMDIADLSYTIQCRLPGERRYRALLGLPLAMALISSYLQRQVPRYHLYIGEIDLLRQVRQVPEDLILDLWQTIEEGQIEMPVRLFCPRESAAFIGKEVPNATVVVCEKLDDAVYGTWPDLRPPQSATGG